MSEVAHRCYFVLAAAAAVLVLVVVLVVAVVVLKVFLVLYLLPHTGIHKRILLMLSPLLAGCPVWVLQVPCH